MRLHFVVRGSITHVDDVKTGGDVDGEEVAE